MRHMVSFTSTALLTEKSYSKKEKSTQKAQKALASPI